MHKISNIGIIAIVCSHRITFAVSFFILTILY